MSLLVFFLLVAIQIPPQQIAAADIEAITSIFNNMSISVLASFAIYTTAVLWIFHTKSAGRAWAGMLLPSIIGIVSIYFLLPPSLINFLATVL
jgi:hypothetical protein